MIGRHNCKGHNEYDGTKYIEAIHQKATAGARAFLERLMFPIDTYQFTDYSRYDINMFPEEMKRKQLEEHFPTDLQNTYDLGRRLAANYCI